jgi:hypothetical protein
LLCHDAQKRLDFRSVDKNDRKKVLISIYIEVYWVIHGKKDKKKSFNSDIYRSTLDVSLKRNRTSLTLTLTLTLVSNGFKISNFHYLFFVQSIACKQGLF